MKNTDNSKYSMRLALVLHSGQKVFPVRVKNRDTGAICFRVSAGGNTKQDSVEVPDEDQMIQMVLENHRGIRCRSLDRMTDGIYCLGGRAVSFAELDGIRQR